MDHQFIAQHCLRFSIQAVHSDNTKSDSYILQFCNYDEDLDEAWLCGGIGMYYKHLASTFGFNLNPD